MPWPAAPAPSASVCLSKKVLVGASSSRRLGSQGAPGRQVWSRAPVQASVPAAGSQPGAPCPILPLLGTLA